MITYWLFVLLIIAVVIFFMFIIGKVILYFYRRYNTNIILSEPERNINTIIRLLKINNISFKLFNNMCFPLSLDNEEKTFKVPSLVVNRSGITLISIVDYHGEIDNPYNDNWTMYVNDTSKSINNPLPICHRHEKAIVTLLEEYGLRDVPVKTLIVYPDKNVKFTNRIDTIVPPGKMVLLLQDYKKDKFLSIIEEIKLISKLNEISATYKK